MEVLVVGSARMGSSLEMFDGPPVLLTAGSLVVDTVVDDSLLGAGMGSEDDEVSTWALTLAPPMSAAFFDSCFDDLYLIAKTAMVDERVAVKRIDVPTTIHLILFLLRDGLDAEFTNEVSAVAPSSWSMVLTFSWKPSDMMAGSTLFWSFKYDERTFRSRWRIL